MRCETTSCLVLKKCKKCKKFISCFCIIQDKQISEKTGVPILSKVEGTALLNRRELKQNVKAPSIAVIGKKRRINPSHEFCFKEIKKKSINTREGPKDC